MVNTGSFGRMGNKYQIESALTEFEKIVEKPDLFLSCQESFSEQIKLELKKSYDALKLEHLLSINALPELLTSVFETEQIWQQIELQNEEFSKKSVKNVSKVLASKSQLVLANLNQDEKINNYEDTTNTEHEVDFSVDSNKESDESSLEENELELYKDSEILESDHDSVSEDTGAVSSEKFHNTKNKKRSVVEDDFFKLDEMESFLKAEENKIQDQNGDKVDEESDSEEGSIDLFKADFDQEEDEKVKTAKFKDFFVQNVEEKPSKRNKFLEDMNSDDDKPVKSSFEARQERLQQKIEEIEDNAIREKPWNLKGEISAGSRPHNSLLEEIVEFDLTSRPAPVITQKVTHQLEDIIKQRIKDKHFDSVERKEKPVESLLEYKKKLVLDQEKSKYSLAQIYEKEFMDQQTALNSDHTEAKEEEPQLHKEIKVKMRDVFNKLDSLSNFHFTPKPAIPELKIVTNLPAIVMEEVAPVTASDSTLLAPEEIRNKPRGDLIGKSESTKTDKKRERRKKKLKQKLHVKTINKNLLPGSKTNKKVLKGKHTEKMKETLSNKSFKSSRAFFTQLQEQVQSTIKDIKVSKSTNKIKKLSAKKLKL